jgi:hypothetical protein
MSEARHLLPQYAFIAWSWTVLPFIIFTFLVSSINLHVHAY